MYTEYNLVCGAKQLNFNHTITDIINSRSDWIKLIQKLFSELREFDPLA